MIRQSIFKKYISDPTLVASELYTLSLLHKLSGTEDFIIASYVQISEQSIYSYPTTARAIDNLQKKNYIEIEKGKGWEKKIILKTSIYNKGSEEYKKEPYIKYTYRFFDFFFSSKTLYDSTSGTRAALVIFYDVINSKTKSIGRKSHLKSLSDKCYCCKRTIKRIIDKLKKDRALNFKRNSNGFMVFWYKQGYMGTMGRIRNYYRDRFLLDKILRKKGLSYKNKTTDSIAGLITQYRSKKVEDVEGLEKRILKGLELGLDESTSGEIKVIHSVLKNYLNNTFVAYAE